jgi:hypothetical protein
MNDDELRRRLEERGAVVVHFSHHANMRVGGVFPVDMHEAIVNKDDWALSCSVLWPGHGMEPCGSVGVMFKPSAASVLSVWNEDSGSRTNPDGTDQSRGVPLTAESFEMTFQVVGAYNEWRVRGAEVAGIFVHNALPIMVKKLGQVLGLPNGEILHEICGTPIPLSEVFAAFPTLPIFTMTQEGLKELARP